MSDIVDSLWVDKYRPKKINDLVLPPQYKDDFERVIAKQSLPNLLLAGAPGSGKTTLALLLCSKYGVLFNPKDNLLIANGSAKQTRNIAFVDSVIEPFLKYPPSKDKYKVVFIDEADKMTTDAYDSFRGIIEKYQVAYGRFIFTCNYLSKIPDALQSRFTTYIFQQISKEYVYNYCKNILDCEKVNFTDKDINFIINNLYPDIRKIVNTLQRNSKDGKLVVNEQSVVTKEKIIISSIVEIITFLEKNEDNKIGKNINIIIETLNDQDIEYKNLYNELFFMQKIPPVVKVIVNKYSMSQQNSIIPQMNFMAMIFEIVKSLQEYRKLAIGK